MTSSTPDRPDLYPTEDDEMPRIWNLSSVEPETDQGQVRGTRREAVAAAGEATDRTGRKVYVEPADTVVDTGPAR